MKKLLTTALLASTLSTAAMAAEDNTLAAYGLTFSGNVALTSDYRFRGMTQTLNDPAIQGSFTLAHSSGLYFSTFASNVDFDGDNVPHLELDPSVGFTFTLPFSDKVKPTLDLGVVEYNYPSHTKDWDWTEFYAKLTFASLMLDGDSLFTNVNYTNDWGGYTGSNAWNFNASYSFPIAKGFGGVLGAGYSKADKDIFGYGDKQRDDFVDWKAGVTYGFKSVPGLTAELDAIGNNFSTTGLPNSVKRETDTGAVFTLTKTF
ncbi:TorF family putative porin [Acinetobacter sp. MB5]|uniref:TorF family putative porin n=1 Tax=Acinetobacter sp. MB5 TaxID=2069438 RepID=UPI000DD02054|nr:TorF family putative porin [Acinetobacter sp. MB5]